jgi:hypothetical protein
VVSIPSSRCAAPALGRARNLRRICLGNPLGVVHLLNARNHSVGARTRLPPLTRLRARQNTVGMAAKTCSPDCEERGEQDVCIDQRGGGDPPSTRGCGRGPVHQAWAASRAARQLSVTRPVPRNGPGRVRCSRTSDASCRFGSSGVIALVSPQCVTAIALPWALSAVCALVTSVPADVAESAIRAEAPRESLPC